jgi:hypothetical protein
MTLVTPDPLEVGDRPRRKSRTLKDTEATPARALDDRCQPGAPHTDDDGAPRERGCPLQRRSTAVPVGPPRPSSITHPEVAPATVTCIYIGGWHRWILGWGN